MAWYVQENTISIYTSIHLHIYAGLYYTSMHLYIYTYAYLVVSWHGGTPSHHRYHDTKVASFWMIWGYPYFRKPPYMYHICIIIYIYIYTHIYIYIYIYIHIYIYIYISLYIYNYLHITQNNGEGTSRFHRFRHDPPVSSNVAGKSPRNGGWKLGKSSN